jgi:hypothetical protein
LKLLSSGAIREAGAPLFIALASAVPDTATSGNNIETVRKHFLIMGLLLSVRKRL